MLNFENDLTDALKNLGAGGQSGAPSGGTEIDKALASEGISGRKADFIKSIYQQESSSGKNTKTSNAGAVGGMQIIPSTFISVADKGWDINNPEHNLRAGIRYASQGFDAAGGDPALAGAYYYGGPGGMNKARQGVAVRDPRNPNAPDTLEYGRQVASRMGGAASASPAAPTTPSAPTATQEPGWAQKAGRFLDVPKLMNDPTVGDYAKQLLASGTESVGSLFQAAGTFIAAPIANAFTGTNDYEGINPLGDRGLGVAKGIRESMTEGGKAAMQDQIKGDLFDPATWETPNTTGGWLMAGMNALGSLGGVVVTGLATGGAGLASQASRIGQAAQAARAAGDAAKAAELAAKAARLGRMASLYGAGIGAATTAGDAAGDGTQQAREFMKDMSHEDLMSIPVYAAEFGDSGDEQQARRAVENSAGRWAGLLSAGPGAVGGAAASRLIADTLMKRGGSALLGNLASSTAGRVSIGATAGAAGGALEETAEKVGTNMGANIATGRDPYDNVTRDTAAEAFGGALGGKAIGVMGSIAAPQLPPALQPVADKAAEPNSPLSKAAMAGVQTGAAQAAMQPAAPQVDPVQRLAELEAIGQDKPAQQVVDEAGNPLTVPGERGRFFTPEEKAEYDQLKALRDSTPGMTPEDVQQAEASQRDEILERVTQIRELLRTPGTMDALRAEGSPITVQKLLGDLATAASKSASPAVREQALNRIEMAAEMVGLDLQPRADMPRSQTNEQQGPPTRAAQATSMVTSAANISADDRVEALQAISAYRNRNLPTATRQAALNRALEIVGRSQAPAGTPSERQTPAVLGEIPPQPNTPAWFEAEAKRREEGAWQFRQLGYDEEADALLDEIDPLLEAAASARAGELGIDDTPDADIVAPEPQQTVDQATQGLPRAQIPAEDPAVAAADNTAARRKRRGQFRQLADLGFDTVERAGDGFVLRNVKSGKSVTLDSAADAQLARMAIKDAIDAKANTAAASPLNDRLEPTEAQIRAGNYKKSDVIDVNGVKVKIENPRGSVRRGVGADGKAWETQMQHHYGEIVGTEGADGDRVDVFIGNRPDSNKIFVIDQVNQDGSFDEHKVVFGALDEADARRTYLSNYDKGWTGLGAIKEMDQKGFAEWVKSRSAKKPASMSEAGTVTAKSGDQILTFRAVPTSSLPEQVGSPARGARGPRITQRQASSIKALAAFFGKDAIFFSDPERKLNSDGFVKGDDNSTIYIDEASGISPLAVFGHELMHLLKRDNPVAYAAIEKVVREKVADPKGFRANYEGKKVDEVKDGELGSKELEELISDLNGNLMGNAEFWQSVFDQIQKDAGSNARGIIAQLRAIFQRMINSAIGAFKGRSGFKADDFIKDAEQVRAAFAQGLAQYATRQGITKAALQADFMRADRKIEGDGIQRSPARAPDDGLTVTGYHFSKAPRQTLTTGFYGTGLQGSDREQIMAHPDRRLRERLSFYANKGTGVRPESGVGGIAHKAELKNIYDADADMKRLKEGRDRRDFESAVLNAGYSGYLSRLEGSQPAQVILLGRQSIQPEVLGPRTQIDDAPMVPAKQQRQMNLGDKILANKSLPAGKMPPQTWAKILMATMPEEAAQLLDVGALGTQDVYKDELVRMIREADGEIRRSPARARDEFAEVEAKYKDTDQWLKAPNGKPTNLNKRQWVQVRTPAFKKWFGDWEAAAKANGVWVDDSVSKAVDDNGEPMVVYHGTDKGGFMSFERPSGKGRGDLGIFTTPNRGMARSYVRKGRAKDIEAPDVPTTQSDLEDLGYSFESYQGRLSSKQAENQELFSYVTPDGDEVSNFTSMEAAVADAIEEYSPDEFESQPGVYALFVSIRKPHESNFEGALWNGERPEQYQVRDENDEPIESDGRVFFDLETARRLVAENEGAELQPADSHYETTDDVVKDARLYKNDGAIIREVVDDGGGIGYDMSPSDVFVAFDPSQLKSADFNGGEFDANSDDIRRSPARQDPADGDKTDVTKLPAGRAIPQSAAVGSLENSLAMARSKSYRRGRDLKQDLQSAVLAAAKAARVKLNERTKATHAFLSTMVYEDAKFALKSNENAVGWYDQKVSRAIGALSTVHPEINTDKRARLAFLWALATTSNGLKVDKNFELAEAAYRAWKDSSKDPAKRRMPTNVGIGNAAQAINKGMDAYNKLAGKVGEERLLKFMGTKFEVGQIERMLDMKVGGEWKSTPVRGAAILGPKIGNGFFSNLNGYFDALTMDRWLMRTWGRMTGTLLEVTKKDIDKSRNKLAAKIADMTDAERRTMSSTIGTPVRKKMTKAELDAVAKASQKASMKKDKRDVMMASEGTNEFRKAANLHHMTMDGQKEAPSGPAERNWIRAVFQDSLQRLRDEDLDMTMSDLQALLWYPERRLYDAAKSDEDVANGYEDDEAPDYANAAFNLAAAQGIDKATITAAMDEAEKRGTVQGEQLTEAEKAEMLETFRSPPAQPFQIVFEVAPNPDDTELTARWNALSPKAKAEITERARDAVVRDLAAAFDLKGKVVRATGGYEGFVNPNLILGFQKKELTNPQARAFSSAVGLALDQKSVVLLDGRGNQSVGIVRLTLSEKADKHVAGMMRLIGEALPGVQDFTARGNNIDILNFSDFSTEELHSKIIDAIEDYEGDVDALVTFGDIKSELIGKDSYESEIRGLGPESGQDLLERARAARGRAREFLAAELERGAVEVPGRAAVARRADAGTAAAAAGRAEAGAVPDAGGIQRSPGRLEASGRPDQGTGREEDGSLKGLPRDFTVAGIDIRASHWAPAEAVARKYMADAGLEYRPPTQYAKVDKERAARIAAEYDRMKHDPKNPMVKAAYKALAKETIAQYKAVVDSGLQVEFIDFASQGDPYAASPRLATEDVRNNNHMWVFSTRDGFGSDAAFDPEDNPLLAETEFMISGQRALVNDLFRVVHDYFGHVKEGVGFRADGEENTWRAHSSMFSPLAQRALTTETRGQNSWVNFGPYGEKNRTASAGETRFADQKTGLLPLWVSEEGRFDDITKSPARADDDEITVTIGDDAPAKPQATQSKDEVGADEAKGRSVRFEVEVEDTGDVATMTVDAGEALRDYDERIDTMKKLLECLKK